MIDYHKELVTALNTVLPTYHEMTLHKGIKTPCASYLETNNYTSVYGDALGYSRITFQIKIWHTDIAVIQKYALQIDEVVRPLGFVRVSSGELYDKNSSMIQKIMSYEALAKESF